MNYPVFDLHCDTALALLGKDMNQPGSLRKNELHIDLERASALPGYCQCFACFTTPYMEDWAKISPVVAFERELATIQREIHENRDRISLAYSPEDIVSNLENGMMSAVLTIEGPAGFGFDPELLEDLYLVGFRISSLGWNEKNPLTGSHITGGGLTDQGREYVREAQRLGILVDVSHISDEGFWDIIQITEAPVVATHSNSRSVWNNTRNLTDDMFRPSVRRMVLQATMPVMSLPEKDQQWIRYVTISFIFLNWIPAVSILHLAEIWMVLKKCRRDSTVFRAGRFWLNGCSSAVWMRT